MFITRQPGTAARTCWTARAGSASPARTTVSAPTRTVSSARSRPRADGTALSSPARQGSDRSARASRSRTTSTRPPASSSGEKISNTDTSKLSEVDATMWASPRPVNSAAAQSVSATTEACGTTTPLGRPVEPEVWMT